VVAVALVCHVKYWTATKWRTRGIPAKHLPRLLEKCAPKGVSAEALINGQE
jgi:hypothetical protein